MKKTTENNWAGTLTGHTEKINDYDFSTDGEFIVSASDDRKVKIWDANKGYEIITLSNHSDNVKYCRFTLDGNRVVTSSDNELIVWHVGNWNKITSFPIKDLSFTYSPNGNFFSFTITKTTGCQKLKLNI